HSGQRRNLYPNGVPQNRRRGQTSQFSSRHAGIRDEGWDGQGSTEPEAGVAYPGGHTRTRPTSRTTVRQNRLRRARLTPARIEYPHRSALLKSGLQRALAEPRRKRSFAACWLLLGAKMSDARLKPMPVPDQISQPFWEAAKARQLAVQRCQTCHYYNHPPRTV